MDGRPRIERIVSRILALSESEAKAALRTTEVRFAARHVDLRSVFDANFAAVAARHLAEAGELSVERKLLIGAYFTQEYSIESCALSNPSIVKAPDQQGLAPGEQRFVLSLRAIGEGHISSIEFRSGVIDAGGQIEMEAPSRHAGTAFHRAPIYEKDVFEVKLRELHAYNEIAATVLGALPERFTLEQLEKVIHEADQQHGHRVDAAHATRSIHWLASSNYESSFAPDSELSERVLFPAGPTESQGMEDARFVRFTYDDGSVTYFAPYTAYDGYEILPQLIETADFVTFRIATLNGASAKNKGIALFPRMIDGRYVALSRLDNENNFLMWSDNVRFWHQNEVIQRPERAWEITQLGNCGSPLETEAGWLVITHGVGAMRQYALGAVLLDKEDPARVIGHLAEPLLEPEDDERDGYVPNVVYSCGSMISGGLLVLPYGFSDIGTRIATVRLDDLLAELTRAR
ncbi:MAG TPA: glycoside hydrolase family 130 protein [Polyangiales bacterium]|nr:glycoside hydrolase family 130 protein [Polyangiales bacterium]